MKVTVRQLRKFISEEVFRAYANSAGFGGSAGISAGGGSPSDDLQLGDKKEEDDVKEEKPEQFTARVRQRIERPRRSH